MNLDNSANAVKDYIMTNIDYFKLQAKNLLKDYQTRYLSEDGEIYETEFTDNGENENICLGSGSDWRVYLVKEKWEDTI